MQEINKMLFDLDEVFRLLPHGKIDLMLNKLIKVKIELDDSQFFILSRGNHSDRDVALLTQIAEQMTYLDKNIHTLTNALLCHETKTFEKRTLKPIDGYINLCLN